MEFIKKDKKIIIISVALAALITFAWGIFSSYRYSEKIQTGIAEDVVRFHVLANSNSEEDQALKLLVRDNVLKTIAPRVEGCQSKAEAIKALRENSFLIKQTALNTITESGKDYSVKVKFENCMFPLKNYGKASFPAGYYDALRIEIGNADGKNWWCVMYPSLCFVDESLEYENGEKLKNILTDEEYSIVMGEGRTPEFKFKIVEWWQERKG